MFAVFATAVAAVTIVSTPNMVDAITVRVRQHTLAHGHDEKNNTKNVFDDAARFIDALADELSDVFLSSSSSSGSFGSTSGGSSSFSEAEVLFEGLEESEDLKKKKNATKQHHDKKHAAKNSKSGSGSDLSEESESSSSGSFNVDFISTSGSVDEIIEIPDNNQYFEEVIDFDSDEEVVETIHIPAGQAHDITIRVKKGQLSLLFGDANGSSTNSTSSSVDKIEEESENELEVPGKMEVKHSTLNDFERQNGNLILGAGAAIGITASVIGLLATVISRRSNHHDRSMLSNSESSAVDEEAEEDAEASTQDALETGRAEISATKSLVDGEEDAIEGKFEGST
jgi:hypothetical protein